MLDQPVPNPLAKNPNVHTHKVFAAVGLILIGTIIASAGIWWFVNNQSGTTTSETEDTSTKVSTTSAKKTTKSAEKDETTNWKTFKTLGSVEFKYPSDLILVDDFGEGTFYSATFINNQSEIDNGNNCNNKRNCYSLQYTATIYFDVAGDSPEENPYYISPSDRGKEYAAIESMAIGTTKSKTTRIDNLIVNNSTWLRVDDESETVSQSESRYAASIWLKQDNNHYHRFSINSDFKDGFDQHKKNLEKIASSFKVK